MMAAPLSLVEQLIAEHLESGDLIPGSPISLRVDQALTPDTTGAAVMLELEAMNLDRARALSVVYVDHNLLQTDGRSASDHEFLLSGCRRYGLWYSPAGNGISHVVHMQQFGLPGSTLVGADSHTPGAGALGMLAIGVGGLEVALAIAGRPLQMQMPKVWNIRLHGELPDWVSAKDIILELLRRHDVTGGNGYVIEYSGSGLDSLSVMDRHVIANMGTELGAISSVFPADESVRSFLDREGRVRDFRPLSAHPGAEYDRVEEIDLRALVPLVAKPHSPGNVVPVREVAGTPVGQSYLGSSANPSLRDLMVPAIMLRNRSTANNVSFDVNPASREILSNLITEKGLELLVQAGARLHQAGCNGCVGMGQAPIAGKASVRTTPRNFRGRTGTLDDEVYLASPETAAASALAGVITDPRDLATELGIPYPRYEEPGPGDYQVSTHNLVPPLPLAEAVSIELAKGVNIASFPDFDPLPELIDGPVLLRLGDGISTDEILQGGQEVLPLRSNIPATAEFAFRRVDPEYVSKAKAVKSHFIVAGENFGQGSSREHAVLAPRFLGLRATIAMSYSRIFWRNLTNFGVLALEFLEPEQQGLVAQGDRLAIRDARNALSRGTEMVVANLTSGGSFPVRHRLNEQQIEMVLGGSLLSVVRDELNQ